MSKGLQCFSLAALLLGSGCLKPPQSKLAGDDASTKYQLHDIGHVVLGGGAAILVRGDIVQIMLATRIDAAALAEGRDEAACVIANPDDRPGYTNFAPLVMFWKMFSGKNKSTKLKQVDDIFEGLSLSTSMFDPEPEHLNELSDGNLDYVRVSRPPSEDFGLTPYQIVRTITSGDDVEINFLATPKYRNGSCELEVEYWCDIASDMCTGAKTFAERKEFRDGFEIVVTPFERKLESIDSRTQSTVEFEGPAEPRERPEQITSFSGDEHLVGKLVFGDFSEVFEAAATAVGLKYLSITITDDQIREFARQNSRFLSYEIGGLHDILDEALRFANVSEFLLIGNPIPETNRDFVGNVRLHLREPLAFKQTDFFDGITEHDIVLDEVFYLKGLRSDGKHYYAPLSGAQFNGAVVNKAIVDDDEGIVLELEDGKFAPFDIKDVVKFYEKHEDAIEQFRSSLTSDLPDNAIIYSSILRFMRWFGTTNARNRVLFEVGGDHPMLENISTLLASVFMPAPIKSTIDLLVKKLRKIVISTTAIKFVIDGRVEGIVDANGATHGMFGTHRDEDGDNVFGIYFGSTWGTNFEIKGISVRQPHRRFFGDRWFPLVSGNYALVEGSDPYAILTVGARFERRIRILRNTGGGRAIYENVRID